SWSGGAFDLAAKVKGGGMYADFIHKTFGDSETAWGEASPMKHIEDAKNLPPFLFASAEDDKPDSKAATEKMTKLSRQAGGKAAYTVLKGKSHFTASHELGQPGDTSGMLLLEFIRGDRAR